MRRRQEFVNAEGVPLEWRLRWGTQDLVEWADTMVGRKDGGSVVPSRDTSRRRPRGSNGVISGEIEVPS